jgi:hypothetical protein
MSTLIEEWKSHCANIGQCASAIFATAEVKVTPRGFADPTFLVLTLLARTLSNLNGAMILLEAKRIVEARTIARCCLENLYWVVGLAEDGEEFVKRMRDDELSNRRATGQAILDNQFELGDETEERLRKFMRDLNKSDFANRTLKPKAVAGIRDDFQRTYIFYSQLSLDAAHPSVTALNRYVVSKDPQGPGFDTEPLVRPAEIVETYEYLSMACVGVCVGANQLIGGTKGGEQLRGLSDRHHALSNLSKQD